VAAVGAMASTTGMETQPAINSVVPVVEAGDERRADQHAVMLRGAWADLLSGTLMPRLPVVLVHIRHKRGARAMISAQNSGKEFAASYKGNQRLHFPIYIYRVDFPYRPHSPYALDLGRMKGVTIIIQEHFRKLRTSFSALFSGSDKSKTSIEKM
jgi:hypothetical protein